MNQTSTRLFWLILCCSLFSTTLTCFAQSSDKSYIINQTYKNAVTAVSNNVMHTSNLFDFIHGMERQLQSICAHEGSQRSGATPVDVLSDTELSREIEDINPRQIPDL